MKLNIKNMVCDRCILVVRQLLDGLGLPYRNVQLGEVELAPDPDPEALDSLRGRLGDLGFELLDDRRTALVNRIKSTLIRLVHGPEDQNKKLSVYLSEAIGKDYHTLSTLFSAVEGISIEKWVIRQRIERAKELLLYDDRSINDIAFDLGYSSVQHLSQQFKKVTGLTPSHFRQLKEDRRTPLDKL